MQPQVHPILLDYVHPILGVGGQVGRGDPRGHGLGPVLPVGPHRRSCAPLFQEPAPPQACRAPTHWLTLHGGSDTERGPGRDKTEGRQKIKDSQWVSEERNRGGGRERQCHGKPYAKTVKEDHPRSHQFCAGTPAVYPGHVNLRI
jgi:hypothetical protein